MLRIILIILFFSLPILSQTKYYIFFKDKGFIPGQNSEEEILAYKIAKESISQRALDRRLKSNPDKAIDFDDLPLCREYIREIEKLNVKIKNRLKWFNAVTAYLTNEQLRQIEKLEFVKSIRKVASVKISKPIELGENLFWLSKTGQYNLDYGNSLIQLELSDIPLVHDMGIDGSGIRIGIMDTGFDWKNQKSTLGAKIIAEHDFVFGDDITANEANDNISQHNHGTLVLSTIAGKDEGNLIGAAFNAEFVLAKTEDIRSETHAEEDNYAAALEWFEALGVDISTSSLGYSEFDPSEFSYSYADMNGKTAIVTRACEKAFQKGMVVVTSAGNEGNSSWHYITAPGDGFNTITVGAVSLQNIVASFSSRGPTADGRIKPDVCAMGVGVFAADARTKDYAFFSGTSLSAPLAAGMCALLLSKYPYLKNSQVRQIILEASDNVKSPDNERGYGLLSALKAVTFPHIKEDATGASIVKMFYDENGIDISSVSIKVNVNGAEETFNLTLDSDNSAIFPLSEEMQNNNISFSFTYRDNSGKWHRLPASAAYSKVANSNLVKLYTGEVIYSYIPENYKLSHAFPNPFNESTKIEYELPRKSDVSIDIYDILGRRIMSLDFPQQPEGFYTKQIKMGNYSSGIYIISFRAGDFTQKEKILLLK